MEERKVRTYGSNASRGDKDFFEPLMLVGQGPSKLMIWWSQPKAKIKYRVLIDINSELREVDLLAKNKDKAKIKVFEYYQAGKLS